MTLAPLAISMGEPAGIGPDIILSMFAERAAGGLPAFAVYGNAAFFRARAERLGIEVEVREVDITEASSAFPSALPVVAIAGDVADAPGQPTPLTAPLVIEAIAAATRATMHGTTRGLVTAPIAKDVLYGAGFRHPGHTEYLAELCAQGGVARLPVMMLAHEELRAVPVTVHVGLADVPRLLTARLVADTIRVVDHDLRTRFGIAAPHIAVAGLNPHAGENGSIGHGEEGDAIRPAIEALRAEGMTITGPLPADTLFYPPHWRRYDAVIAMYHDQALIPIKTVAFEDAVNITLGLPIVRTSPDHGTAYDLAGTGRGSKASFLAALRLADRLTAPTA